MRVTPRSAYTFARSFGFARSSTPAMSPRSSSFMVATSCVSARPQPRRMSSTSIGAATATAPGDGPIPRSGSFHPATADARIGGSQTPPPRSAQRRSPPSLRRVPPTPTGRALSARSPSTCAGAIRRARRLPRRSRQPPRLGQQARPRRTTCRPSDSRQSRWTLPPSRTRRAALAQRFRLHRGRCDLAYAVAVQPDGKIVAAGYAAPGAVSLWPATRRTARLTRRSAATARS